MKPQNVYRYEADLAYLRPMLDFYGKTVIIVCSAAGEVLWRCADRTVADIITRHNGLTPVSVH